MLLIVILHFFTLQNAGSSSDLLTLVINKHNDPFTSLSSTINVRRGSKFSLTCVVQIEQTLSNDTLWSKCGTTLARYQLSFNRVKLKDQGEYVCTAVTFELSKSIQIKVLPKLISSQLKEKVYKWIYPVRTKRFDLSSSSSSSSSDSREKRSKHDSPESYRDFWIVVFVILVIGTGIGIMYYILKRYWWKARSNITSRLQNHRLRQFHPVAPILRPLNDECDARPLRELIASPPSPLTSDDGVSIIETNTDLPPSYSAQFNLNIDDLPPSYEQAVARKS